MSIKPITTTAALSLKRNVHAGAWVVLDNATGKIITLPASAGTGDKYKVYVKTTVSSGNHVIQVANGTDVLFGGVALSTDIGGTNMLSNGTNDTITMNGSTTGGLAGSWVTFEDVVTGFWKVEGFLVTTGTEATPFSAAVS